MAGGDAPEELFSTLMFGDNEELDSFLAEDLGDFRRRIETTQPQSVFPFLFLIGDEDELPMLIEELESVHYSPKAYPLKAEDIEKTEEVKVEESGSGCSICLDKMPKGSEAKRLPCSHIYHRDCIGKWLLKKNTCPLCRRDVNFR